MTTIHLVRHGETLWHAENRYAGSSDVALTRAGKQARELAGWVERRVAAGVGSAVVTSTDARDPHGPPAAEVLGLVPRADARLCRCTSGAAGMTRAEMEEIFPDAVAAFLANPRPRPSGRRAGSTRLPGRAAHRDRRQAPRGNGPRGRALDAHPDRARSLLGMDVGASAICCPRWATAT